MGVVITILTAVGALAGPFATLVTALWHDAEGIFGGGTASATPDELATEAIDIATKAATLVADAKAQIAIVTQALQESHSDLTVVTATHLATAAVKHVSTTTK